MGFKVNDRVKIISNCASNGMIGTVVRIVAKPYSYTGNQYVVKFSEKDERMYGKTSLQHVNDEGKREPLTGFPYVLIAEFFGNNEKKRYAFALYKEEMDLLTNSDSVFVPEVKMVVVNSKHHTNRELAIAMDIIPIESYDGSVSITAEVVGVVNMDSFIKREDEKKRMEENRKRKADVEKELENRINKLKNAEYYERMAKEFFDKDPELMKLVEEFKELGKR